jgi:hypothetical protein
VKRGFLALACVLGLIGCGAVIWRMEGALSALARRVESMEQAGSAMKVGTGLPKGPELYARPEPEGFAVLSRRIGELAARIDALDSAVKTHQTSSDVQDAAERPAQTKPPDTLLEPPDPAAVERTQAARWADIARRFLDEPVDGSWGPSTEASLFSSFTNDEVLRDVELNAVECRSQGCRLSWRYPQGMTSEESFVLENTVYAAFGKAGLNTITSRGDDAGGLESYAFRSGASKGGEGLFGVAH